MCRGYFAGGWKREKGAGSFQAIPQVRSHFADGSGKRFCRAAEMDEGLPDGFPGGQVPEIIENAAGYFSKGTSIPYSHLYRRKTGILKQDQETYFFKGVKLNVLIRVRLIKAEESRFTDMTRDEILAVTSLDIPFDEANDSMITTVRSTSCHCRQVYLADAVII